MPPRNDRAQCFVANIKFEATDSDLATFLASHFGPVVSVSRRPRSGFGFIEFADEEFALKAVVGSGIIFEGRELEIRIKTGYVCTSIPSDVADAIRLSAGTKPHRGTDGTTSGTSTTTASIIDNNNNNSNYLTDTSPTSSPLLSTDNDGGTFILPSPANRVIPPPGGPTDKPTQLIVDVVRSLGGDTKRILRSICGDVLIARGLVDREDRHKAIGYALQTGHVELGGHAGHAWICLPGAAPESTSGVPGVVGAAGSAVVGVGGTSGGDGTGGGGGGGVDDGSVGSASIAPIVVLPNPTPIPINHQKLTANVTLVVEVVRTLGGRSRNVLLAEVGQALKLRGLETKEIRHEALAASVQAGVILQGGVGVGTWVRLSDDQAIIVEEPKEPLSSANSRAKSVEAVLDAIVTLDKQGNGPRVLRSMVGSLLKARGMGREERVLAFKLAHRSQRIVEGGTGDSSWMMLRETASILDIGAANDFSGSRSFSSEFNSFESPFASLPGSLEYGGDSLMHLYGRKTSANSLHGSLDHNETLIKELEELKRNRAEELKRSRMEEARAARSTAPSEPDELWRGLCAANALEYYKPLKDFGVDTAKDFMELRPDDLFSCKIFDLRVREAIVEALTNLNAPIPFNKNSSITTLLDSLHLSELYGDAFKAYGVDCVADLDQLKDDDWVQLKVRPLHQRKILGMMKDTL